MNKKLFSITGLLAITITGLFLSSGTANAVPLGPDKYFFDLKEGEERTEELKIYGKENLSDSQKVYIYVLGMRKTGEENDREFYTVDKNDKAEVANWIDLGFAEAKLNAGETVILPWKIKKSGSAKCGTNLAAIVVATSPESNTVEGAKVSIKNEVVSQVHVNIDQVNGQPCENKAKLNLLDFRVKNKKSLFFMPNVPLETRIKNDGDIIGRSPRGFIEIKGYGEKSNIPFNEEGLDIYSGTTRKFDNVWADENYPKNGNFFKKAFYELTHLRIGKYTATLGVSKNANPQIIASTSFWVIPWRLLLILLVLLLIVTALIINNFRSRREIKSLKKNPKRL